MEKVTAAAVQATPVFLDREATIDKACRLIGEAAAAGAGLVVFPETFVPTYPDWVWRSTPWGTAGEWFGRLLDQAVVVPSPATEAIGAAAGRAGVWVSIGVNERDPAGSTIYNTQLYLGPDGAVVAKHRKLMPTGGERLVWGMGDGSSLQTVDAGFGRVGGLICWEMNMPLARFALYQDGLEILLAPTADDSDAWHDSMRHIAREARAYIVTAVVFQRASSHPEEVPLADGDDLMGRGGSAILAPDGSYLAGPLWNEPGILTATLDPARLDEERQRFDPAGHYHRPDVFHLTVGR